MILFERGSTGRQHILDAFHEQQLSPQVHMETTTTEIVVRMVEAGLGIAIVPLLPSGAVTRGRKVAIRPIADPIRPIHSGILTRRGERLVGRGRRVRGLYPGQRRQRQEPAAAGDGGARPRIVI